MPFTVPGSSPLSVDEHGRASCMSLAFSLSKMTEEQQVAHLVAHAESCDDEGELAKFCPICVPLRRAYEARQGGERN